MWFSRPFATDALYTSAYRTARLLLNCGRTAFPRTSARYSLERPRHYIVPRATIHPLNRRISVSPSLAFGSVGLCACSLPCRHQGEKLPHLAQAVRTAGQGMRLPAHQSPLPPTVVLRGPEGQEFLSLLRVAESLTPLSSSQCSNRYITRTGVMQWFVPCTRTNASNKEALGTAVVREPGPPLFVPFFLMHLHARAWAPAPCKALTVQPTHAHTRSHAPPSASFHALP